MPWNTSLNPAPGTAYAAEVQRTPGFGTVGSGRGEKNVASQELTGRPVIPGFIFWFLVALGLLVVGLVAFLVVGGT
jgi:hypothetical protein